MLNEKSRSLNLQTFFRYLVTIALLIIIAVSIVMHLHTLQSDMQRVGIERQQKMELTYALRSIIRERMVNLFQMISHEDPFARDENRQQFELLANRFIQTRSELEGLVSTDEERRLFEQLRELTIWGTPHQQKVVDYYDNEQLEEARKYLLRMALPVQNKVLSHCDSIIAFYQMQANADVDKTLDGYSLSHNWLIGLALSAIAMSLLIAFFENRQIRRDREILSIENLHRREAEGNLQQLKQELEQRVIERTNDLNNSFKLINEAQRIGNMGHWDWDVKTGGLKWSEQIFNIFGRSSETTEPSYALFLECIYPDDRESVTGAVDLAVRGLQDYSIDHRIVLPDGTIRYVHEQGEVSKDSDGNPVRMIGTVQDITQQREMIQRLRLSDYVFNNTAEGILITDKDNVILNINAGFTTIMGYSHDDIVGKKPNLLQSGRHDEQFYKAMWLAINEHGSWQGEIWDRHKDGEIFPVWSTINVVKDEQGNLQNYIAVYRDISEAKRSEEELWHIAHHDPLCDLPNRNLMNAYLKQAMAHAKRDDREVALMLIDLDDFKKINDSLGHMGGDQALIKFADILKNSVRESDIVARLAGDEFTVVLSEMHQPSEAEMVAQKIIDALAEPVQIDEHTITMGASIGISIFPTDGTTADYLLKCADQAMYLAKHEGKNSYRVFQK